MINGGVVATAAAVGFLGTRLRSSPRRVNNIYSAGPRLPLRFHFASPPRSIDRRSRWNVSAFFLLLLFFTSSSQPHDFYLRVSRNERGARDTILFTGLFICFRRFKSVAIPIFPIAGVGRRARFYYHLRVCCDEHRRW